MFCTSVKVFLPILILCANFCFAQTLNTRLDTLPHNSEVYQAVYHNVWLPMQRSYNVYDYALQICDKLPSGCFSIAETNYKSKTIYLERKTYDFCIKKYGKENAFAALAFLLGHELTHTTEKNNVNITEKNCNGNGCARNTQQPYRIDTKTDAENEVNGIKKEATADNQGLLYARIAGFKIRGIENLLEKLYKFYDLPPQLQNYPELSDRTSYFTTAIANADRAYALFTAANHCLGDGYVDEAGVLLSHLYYTENLTAPEIANNLAIVYLKKAQYSLQTESGFEYDLPFLMDSQFRSRGEGGKEDGAVLRQKWLDTAATILAKAHTMRPEDTIIRINIALHNILEKYNQNDTFAGNALVTDFNKNANLCRFGKISPILERKTSYRPPLSCKSNENLREAKPFPLATNRNANIALGQTADEWTLVLKKISIQGTDSGAAKTTRGIHVGSTTDELIAAYCTATIVSTPLHDFYFYTKHQLCFCINKASETVENWSLLREN